MSCLAPITNIGSLIPYDDTPHDDMVTDHMWAHGSRNVVEVGIQLLSTARFCINAETELNFTGFLE